jgi:DNA (cytosine-5)-methyltransferase 1
MTSIFAIASKPVLWLLAFVILREEARHRYIAGASWPCSSDPVLASPNSFCNIRRQDDRGSRWLIEHVCGQYGGRAEFWPAAFAYRAFNDVRTGELFFVQLGPNGRTPFETMLATNCVEPLRLPGRHIGHAYQIRSLSFPKEKMPVEDQLLIQIGYFLTKLDWRKVFEVGARRPELLTLGGALRFCRQVPHIGSFLGAQVVADWRYAAPFNPELTPDWWTFATPGPGSEKGMNILLGHPLNESWKGREDEWSYWLLKFLPLVNRVLAAIEQPPIHAMDLQNVLCELAKACELAHSVRPRNKDSHYFALGRVPSTETELNGIAVETYETDRAMLLRGGIPATEIPSFESVYADLRGLWPKLLAGATRKPPSERKAPPKRIILTPQRATSALATSVELLIGQTKTAPTHSNPDTIPLSFVPLSSSHESAKPVLESRVRTERTFLEFFAGGGMARLGLGSSWRCLFANDIDPDKGTAYATNFGGDVLVVGDAASLTTADLPGHADLAWMSPPCRDLSEAGPRVGLKGNRSGAFWSAWRLIEGLNAEGRAPWTIVLENVTGLLASHSGADIATIRAAFEREGYAHATAIIDAARFVPQSRARVFVVGARAADPSPLVENAFAALPLRNVDLIDALEDGPHLEWCPLEETRRHLGMMGPANLAKVEEARAAGRPIAGCGYRRMRPDGNGGRVQRLEVRFDLAGALRVASTGGSSVQFVLVIDGAETRMRAMTPREYARLMGLPDDYRLPENAGEARSLCGDGVCVPVVRFLAEHVIEPLLNRSKRGA